MFVQFSSQRTGIQHLRGHVFRPLPTKNARSFHPFFKDPSFPYSSHLPSKSASLTRCWRKRGSQPEKPNSSKWSKNRLPSGMWKSRQGAPITPFLLGQRARVPVSHPLTGVLSFSCALSSLFLPREAPRLVSAPRFLARIYLLSFARHVYFQTTFSVHHTIAYFQSASFEEGTVSSALASLLIS